MSTRLPPIDVVLVGFGWTAAIMGQELTDAGLQVLALERGKFRDTVPDFATTHVQDELRYAVRRALFERPARATLTFRHSSDQTALPMRHPGSFLPASRVGGTGRAPCGRRVETQVVGVSSGSRTLKDALNEAMRDWVSNVDDTFYIIGTVAGPHPYPAMVRDFQAIIGRETRAQCLAREGRLPDALVACVGGGSNAIGLFYPFINDPSVRLIGVEAGGDGLATGRASAGAA